MGNLDYILSKVKKLPEAYIAEEICRRACERLNLNIKKANALKKSLTPITPLKNNGVINLNPLHPFNNKGYRAFLTPITPTTPKNDNIKTINLSLEAFEEQVAIIEYDGKIPYEWAEAIGRTKTRIKPITISNDKWGKIQNALETLLPYLETIVTHDWKLSDIFGCHKFAPEARYDVMGLLMLLNEGERIIEITRDAIRIQNKQGAVQSYSRPFYDYQTEQSCLYEMP